MINDNLSYPVPWAGDVERRFWAIISWWNADTDTFPIQADLIFSTFCAFWYKTHICDVTSFNWCDNSKTYCNNHTMPELTGQTAVDNYVSRGNTHLHLNCSLRFSPAELMRYPSCGGRGYGKPPWHCSNPQNESLKKQYINFLCHLLMTLI